MRISPILPQTALDCARLYCNRAKLLSAANVYNGAIEAYRDGFTVQLVPAAPWGRNL